MPNGPGGSTGSSATRSPRWLPAGSSATHVVADPADPNRFYAGIGIGTTTQGVYRSIDGGLTWTQVITGMEGDLEGNAGRIELAVHHNAVP